MPDDQIFLEANLPASIDVEEMIVGRLTAKQLGFVCVGAALSYNLIFKMENKMIGWTLGGLIVIFVYLLAFKKIKKYDRYIYEHWIYHYKYRAEQQMFLNK